jgi:phage shock protein PspC (stress-responsive transcriptional regulator)
MIGGLCSGIAAYLDVDVTIVRVVFVALAALTRASGLLIGGVLTLVIPAPRPPRTSRPRADGRSPRRRSSTRRCARSPISKTDAKWKRQWRRQQREWHRALAARRRTAHMECAVGLRVAGLGARDGAGLRSHQRGAGARADVHAVF